MYAQFIRAIKWNTVGIIFYKIFLFAHQSLLFTYISQFNYGIIGALFSTIYFFIPLSNFGFDYTAIAFFKKRRSQQESSLIIHRYGQRIIALLGIMFTATCLQYYMQFNIPWSLFFTCLGLFFFESIKQSLRTHAHIFHLNKKIAVVENICLLFYIATVWFFLLWVESTSLTVFFLPLLFFSIFEVAYIIFILYCAYTELPKESETEEPLSFFKESGFNYVNQLSKAFFSPNFLILFLAITIGFYKTGYIKFITNIIIFLYTIFYRSIRMSGGALLSSISKMPKSLIKKTFNTITNYYAHILTITSFYFGGLLYYYSQKFAPDSFATYMIILVFCFISFLEYGTLAYETLFITQKRGEELARINILNLVGVGLFLLLSYFFPHPLLLFLLCSLKMSTIAYTIFRASQIWHTSFYVSFNQTVIITHLSIVLFLLSYFL